MQKFNLINVYSKDWPIQNALKLRLKYMSNAEKKKITRKKDRGKFQKGMIKLVIMMPV